MDWLRYIAIIETVIVGLLYLFTSCKAGYFVYRYSTNRRWNIGRVCAGLGVFLINAGTFRILTVALNSVHTWGTVCVAIGELVLLYGWILSGRVTIKEGRPIG